VSWVREKKGGGHLLLLLQRLQVFYVVLLDLFFLFIPVDAGVLGRVASKVASPAVVVLVEVGPGRVSAAVLSIRDLKKKRLTRDSNRKIHGANPTHLEVCVIGVLLDAFNSLDTVRDVCEIDKRAVLLLE
jgi:hypothetical protein